MSFVFRFDSVMIWVKYFFIWSICMSTAIDSQMLMSYGMRRLSLSLNQFGLDLARSMEHSTDSNQSSYLFCPFCVGTSLAILMTALQAEHPTVQQEQTIGDVQFGQDQSHVNRLYESLRYALYVNSMQPQEVNLAFFDLMRHLRVNLPSGFPVTQQSNDWQQENMEDVMFMVNQVYLQRYIPMDYRLFLTVQHYYQTSIRTLDLSDLQESWQHINAKVKHQTHGHIDQVLDSLSAQSSIRLLLLSGVHFQARLDFRHLVKNGRRRRGAFQKLWPIRSPFLPSAGIPHHHLLPSLIHPNHHQQLRPTSPQNRPPFGLLFKPWLADVNVAATTTSTTTTTTTTTPSPVDHSSTTTKATTSALMTDTNSMVLSSTFNPFEPYEFGDSKENERVFERKQIRLRFQRNDYLNSSVIELPFVGGTVSMLILVPDSATQMSAMLSRMNGQLIIDLLQTVQTQRIDLRLPLFTNHSHSIGADRLNRLLTSIGLGDLFANSDNDFLEQHKLFAAMQIHHKCIIDIQTIDEDDLQTSENIITSSTRQMSDQQQVQSQMLQLIEINQNISKTENVRFDLENASFFYLIIDNISGLIILMGKHFK